MQVPLSDGGYILFPVAPPPDIPDVTIYPVHFAALPDGPGEPDSGDYVDGSWVDGEAGIKLADLSITTAGRYKLWVKIVTSQETKVIPGQVIGVGY